MPFSALEVMQCIHEMNQLEHVMSVTKSVAIKFNVRLYYLPQDQWTSAGSLAQRSAESPSHPIDLFVEVRCPPLALGGAAAAINDGAVQVHARTQTLAVNAVAQLDSIFAYIASHLAATASAAVLDGHAGSADSGSPHRGLHRRYSRRYFLIIAFKWPSCPLLPHRPSHSISISDGASRRGRIIHPSGGARLRSDTYMRESEAVMRLHADSTIFPLPPGAIESRDAVADSLGGRTVSDGSSR
jgi:hypothetical protein